MAKVLVEITEEMKDARASCSEDSDCNECPCQIGTDNCIYDHEILERKIIIKKVLPKYFKAVIKDKKKFEIRKDEDDVQVGDAIILKEWDGEKYTGREVSRNITYVLRNVPEYGLQKGYCIMCW